jgi:hypothetical protein
VSEVAPNTLVLTFAGYFQMRMATDPDPTDDPRGMSGYTFALPGEPDFDGILRFQPNEPGVFERSFGTDAFAPRVGVKVVNAVLRGMPAPGLVGAAFSLPNARLVERNGLVVRNDYFAIDPVLVRLEQNGALLLERFDELDPKRPGWRIVYADSPMLLRRQPASWVMNSVEVAAATGLPQPPTNDVLIQNRLYRQSCLIELLAQTTDPVARAALDVRIRELSIVRRWWDLSQEGPDGPPIDRRAYTLALQAVGWNIGINGPVLVNTLGADPSVPWPLEFWLGGWDGDALCGYISGSLTIPLASPS